ncbi:MAG: hypothetical protein KAF91_18795 [Nostoc sp. TH1S01]|nr:hypothetical protein [Nostoc sp. TH1S01]
MTQKILYAAWFIFSILAVLVILFIRHRRTSKWNIKLDEVFNVSLAVFGGISGVYLISQTWLHYDTLQKLVSNEGLVAMTLGGLASIWFCISTIGELAGKP